MEKAAKKFVSEVIHGGILFEPPLVELPYGNTPLNDIIRILK